jgi:HEAT repeat protein
MLLALADDDLRVRSQIALAVSGAGVRTQGTPEALMPLLDDRIPRVVAATCKALGNLRHREAVPRLVSMLEEQHDPGTRFAAYNALKAITGKDLGEQASAWREELELREERRR